MGYSKEFSVHTIPKTLNEALRAHWSVNSKEKFAMGLEMAIQLKPDRPDTPIKRAKISIWRHSSGSLDRDNKFFTAKYILDNLVQLKILENDTEKNIVCLDVIQVKTKRGEPRLLRVKIEEVA